MPEIQRLQAKYVDKVKVLAVNSTVQDDESKARDFVRQLGLTFDIPLDRTGEVTEAYQVIFLPTTFVVDPDGIHPAPAGRNHDLRDDGSVGPEGPGQGRRVTICRFGHVTVARRGIN